MKSITLHVPCQPPDNADRSTIPLKPKTLRHCLLKWLELDRNGKLIDFPEVGYKWNKLGELAEKFYDDYSEHTFIENRSHLATIKDRLVNEVSERSDNELSGSPWYGKWTKGRMIQFNSSSPYENARGRVHKWLKRKEL